MKKILLAFFSVIILIFPVIFPVAAVQAEAAVFPYEKSVDSVIQPLNDDLPGGLEAEGTTGNGFAGYDEDEYFCIVPAGAGSSRRTDNRCPCSNIDPDSEA